MRKGSVVTLTKAFLRRALFPNNRADSRGRALPACPWWQGFIRHDCVELRVTDDSMAPTVPRGAALLVDRMQRDWAEPEIVAVRIDGSTIAVRAAHDTAGRRVMVTDNPDWSDVPLPADAKIVGRALCVARTLY